MKQKAAAAPRKLNPRDFRVRLTDWLALKPAELSGVREGHDQKCSRGVRARAGNAEEKLLTRLIEG